MTARKYILIPEFRPLYAMRKCYGPTHGPLSEPTPTPVDVIGELLLQKGNEALTIYEVKVDAKAKTSSEPVRLTLENYTKPYDEIAGAPVNPEPAVTPVEEPTPVVPTVVTPKPLAAQEEVTPEPEQAETVEETPDVKPVEEVEEPATEAPTETDEGETEQTAAPVEETPVEETEEKPAEETEEPEKQETAEEADPFAGMTKAERKAARRAAHQQA